MCRWTSPQVNNHWYPKKAMTYAYYPEISHMHWQNAFLNLNGFCWNLGENWNIGMEPRHWNSGLKWVKVKKMFSKFVFAKITFCQKRKNNLESFCSQKLNYLPKIVFIEWAKFEFFFCRLRYLYLLWNFFVPS